MKIICVGRNYAEHARELGNAVPVEPVIFIKPDTALLRNGDAFYIPDFSSDIHYEVELVLQIGKAGKHIQESFALNYVCGLGIGIDFTARDIQKALKEKGLPWELAKGFDHSAPVSTFLPVTSIEELDNIEFGLQINGQQVQQGNSAQMLFSFSRIISFVSERITLRKGDYIFTGTPPGVGKVSKGDRLQGYLRGDCRLDFLIK